MFFNYDNSSLRVVSSAGNSSPVSGCTEVELADKTLQDFIDHVDADSYDAFYDASEEFKVILKSKEFIELTTDATDSHQPYDGIPDIPADGTSSCDIFIKKKDKDGNYMTEASDSDTIDLSSTRGCMSAIQVQLVNGEAQVSLKSIAETCISEVTAFGGFLISSNIQIQFAPVA